MTDSGFDNLKRSGSAREALPLLFVLAAGVVFQGGDWPPATFLIRVVIFLLAARFLLRNDAITIRPTVPDILVALLVVVEAASLARAEYRWVSYQWFLHHAAAFILYLLLRAGDDPDGRFPADAGRLVVGLAAIEAFVALYQRFFQGAPTSDGTLENPSYLAEILLYGVIVACVFLSGAGRGRAVRWALVAFIALGLAGIWTTHSRAGYLMVLAVSALLAGRTFGWKWSAAILALALAALLVVPNPVLDRFRGSGDPYAFERLNMWKAALRIFADHPAGAGVGHFKYYWDAARDPVAGSLIRYARHAVTPHNEFFSMLSELGIPGAAAFLGLAAAGCLSLRRAARPGDPAATAAAAILAASFLHAVVVTNYHIIGILLLNAAALSVVSGRLWEPVAVRTLRIRGAVRWAGLALLAAMIAYSGMTLAATLLESRGQAALGAGNPAEAARRFSIASAADPWRASAPDQRAAALYRLHESGADGGRLAAAIESEREATERNPLDPRLHARLGFLLAAAADLFPAERRGTIMAASGAAYGRAVKLSPHSAEMRYRMALVTRAAGRPAEARRLLGEALADEPRFAPGWALLGELLEADDRERAASAYERALDLYYTLGKRATGPDEKEFLSLDAQAVESRVRALRADPKR